MLHGNNKQITIPTEQWLQNTFDSNSWVILSAIEQSIKAKIEKYGTPLKDWDVQINYGIKTGCNEAFIITTAKREEILANCKTKDERKRTDEIIRPILRGRDIKRYKYDWKGLWLIGLFPSRHYDIDTLPAIKKYLLDFGFDRLKQTGEPGARKKTSNKWFETQDTIAYWEDFSKPKIAWADISTEPSFVEVSEKFFFNNTCYMLSPAPLYLLGILNSKLIKWFFPKIASDLGEGSRYFKQFVELLPIKKLTQGEISILENLLRKRPIDDEQVNAFVYKQYQLTAEEILFLNHL
ncbi:TaqI-like C-terminal specificity domain-containing protein [Candidatus Avelusimicrobium fimicolum]|uniref:TaqI-like C-terminal specificity domain-containing protein n=1 Tax=Candidatus Avelusimicrobium fimicolum TaxID=3416216 RepID=UPI003D14947F